MMTFTLMVEGPGFDRKEAFRLSEQQVADEFSMRYEQHSLNPINQIEQRNRRHEKVERIALLLGRQITDWLDDKDGFNGERRVELIEAAMRQRASSPYGKIHTDGSRSGGQPPIAKPEKPR